MILRQQAPLPAIGSALITASSSTVFALFVSWISSVVGLDLCSSASLNSRYLSPPSYPLTGQRFKRKMDYPSLPMPSLAEDLGGGGREVVEVDDEAGVFGNTFRRCV